MLQISDIKEIPLCWMCFLYLKCILFKGVKISSLECFRYHQKVNKLNPMKPHVCYKNNEFIVMCSMYSQSGKKKCSLVPKKPW